MTRRRKPPLTLEAIWEGDTPVRVRDLMAITGYSRQIVISAIEAGELAASQRREGLNYCYLIDRSSARLWLEKVLPARCGTWNT